MKKIFILLFFFLICIPIIVRAESVEIPKATRPARITIPETVPIGSTLKDVDEEIARAATLANAAQFTVQNQFGSLNSSNNTSVQNFPAWPVALGPTLEEVLMYQNMPSLTSIMYPPQFLMASSPSLTSVVASDEMVRLAHSGGAQGAAGGSFFGPNLLPPLGLPFGQGPIAAPFLGPSIYQPLPILFPSALLYQFAIPPYAAIPNSQPVFDPFYPFPPTPLPVFRGPGWYPPHLPLLPPQPNLLLVPPPLFW